MNKKQLEQKLHECRCMNDELQHECQTLDAERAELKRKNDDLSISVQHYGDQVKLWAERYNECHAELIEASRKLNDANNTVESLNRVLERFDRDFNKAIAACHQHLLVSLDLPTTKPDCEVCETSRFIYYLLDVLDGK